jgi:hypothetical protein
VTVSEGEDGDKQVVTWNIYGAVKDYEKTFVPIEEYVFLWVQKLCKVNNVEAFFAGELL